MQKVNMAMDLNEALQDEKSHTIATSAATQYSCTSVSNLEKTLRKHSGEKTFQMHTMYLLLHKSWLTQEAQPDTLWGKVHTCNAATPAEQLVIPRGTWRFIQANNLSTAETLAASKLTWELWRKSLQVHTILLNCKTTTLLKVHMRLHSGEMPFGCIACDYSLKQVSHLEAHMRTHSGEKKTSSVTSATIQALVLSIWEYTKTNTSEKSHMAVITSVKFFEQNIWRQKHREEPNVWVNKTIDSK